LGRFWQSYKQMPQGERPLESAMPAAVMPGADDPGARFLDAAMDALRAREA